MNLNEPCFDNVLSIDAQLQKLQGEVAQMSNEFANYRPPQHSSQSKQTAAKRYPVTHGGASSSPEIEEERKSTAPTAMKRTVTFKDETNGPASKSSRDILREQQREIQI